jgi:hypothetical protein
MNAKNADFDAILARHLTIFDLVWQTKNGGDLYNVQGFDHLCRFWGSGKTHAKNNRGDCTRSGMTSLRSLCDADAVQRTWRSD